ncbi:MAG: DinB family protein [Actinomycetota bacterium]
MAHVADPTLDRLFRHEVWALRKMFAFLRSQPESVLAMTAPNTGWDVGVLLAHISSAAMSYVARIEGGPDPSADAPDTHADLDALETRVVAAAERLRALAAEGSDADVVEVEDAGTSRYPRSLILAQAIYHAIEHRAQLFGVLTANGVVGTNLDDLDHWSYGVDEGSFSSSSD